MKRLAAGSVRRRQLEATVCVCEAKRKWNICQFKRKAMMKQVCYHPQLIHMCSRGKEMWERGKRIRCRSHVSLIFLACDGRPTSCCYHKASHVSPSRDERDLFPLHSLICCCCIITPCFFCPLSLLWWLSRHSFVYERKVAKHKIAVMVVAGNNFASLAAAASDDDHFTLTQFSLSSCASIFLVRMTWLPSSSSFRLQDSSRGKGQRLGLEKNEEKIKPPAVMILPHFPGQAFCLFSLQFFAKRVIKVVITARA